MPPEEKAPLLWYSPRDAEPESNHEEIPDKPKTRSIYRISGLLPPQVSRSCQSRGGWGTGPDWRDRRLNTVCALSWVHHCQGHYRGGSDGWLGSAAGAAGASHFEWLVLVVSGVVLFAGNTCWSIWGIRLANCSLIVGKNSLNRTCNSSISLT